MPAHEGLTAAVPLTYRAKDETMQQALLRTTQLGATGLEITRVGFGAWAIGGGGWEFGWGPQEDGESIAAIDLYQIHWPIPEEDIEEGWAAFAELKEQGLVRHIGVSNFSTGQLRRIQSIAPVETLQPPYSLIDRGAENEILPFAEREGIGVIVYSPMASGLLTGRMTRDRIARLPDDDWRKHDPRFREPQLSRHLGLVERLTTVAGRHDTTPGAVAIAWTVRNPAVDGAIAGFRCADQVDPILTAASIELTGDDVDEIEGR